MDLLRKILLPIVPIYYLITWIRNILYDMGVKKSKTYQLPIIAIGNLSVGGTGKSPMVEYLIRLLKDNYRLATLSRGYKRETDGFKLVEHSSTAKEVGDEPLLFKTNFSDVTVAVDSDRRNGIAKLRSLVHTPDIILLDDAFQHRKVKAGLYILLTAYNDLYCNDIVLPTGGLREPRGGADRANIIMVTKCPKELSGEEQKKIGTKLKIKAHQTLFFTSIKYSSKITNNYDTISIDTLIGKSFTLITGIANPKPLIDYYVSIGLNFNHLNYPDHHNFTNKELKELKSHDFIITTEKDFVRLAPDFTSRNLWYQPIKTSFISNQNVFNERILEYIKNEI